jgi:hypothetical protein
MHLHYVSHYKAESLHGKFFVATGHGVSRKPREAFAMASANADHKLGAQTNGIGGTPIFDRITLNGKVVVES